MIEVKYKLKKITKIWNDYILNYKFFQSKIKFDEVARSNYYGEILHYFEDTFELIKPYETGKGFIGNIFNTIGLMQIVFVHQDLVDELLRIFKLSESKKEDKNPNRELRNELTGHPINRNKKRELESSVIFGKNLSKDTIHYVKYAKEDNFTGKEISHSVKSVIERHWNFLDQK